MTWMRICRFAALLAAALLWTAGAAHAQNAPAAQRVFDRAKAVSGGAAWNALRGLHEIGTDDGERYESWADPIRYGLRSEVRKPAGKLVQGYNGAGEWRIMPDGRETGSPDRAVVARVRSDAFFGAYGYLFPSRFDLRSTHLGVRRSQGRAFDVVRVQPAGGQPRELWFDRASGLLGQVVDEASGRRVEVSDYRKVGGVRLPFRYTTFSAGMTAKVRQVERVDFRAADRDIFSLPRRSRPGG